MNVGEIDASDDAAAPAGAAVRRRLSRGWIITIATTAVLGLCVGVIAATGGFRSVASTGPAAYRLGDEISSAEATLVVERVAVMDELWGYGSSPDDTKGERVLAVLVDVTNLDDEPRLASSSGSLADIRLQHRPDDRPTVSIYADDDFSVVTLQPDVPARVLLTWVVEEDEIVDGDPVRLVIPDAEKNDSTIFSGETLWNPLDPAGVVSVRPEDLGPGSEDGRL